MSVKEDSENVIILSFEMLYFKGYPFRKGKVTKTFKAYLKRRGLQYLVDWMEEKEK